jgi:hypothetical protein
VRRIFTITPDKRGRVRGGIDLAKVEASWPRFPRLLEAAADHENDRRYGVASEAVEESVGDGIRGLFQYHEHRKSGQLA